MSLLQSIFRFRGEVAALALILCRLLAPHGRGPQDKNIPQGTIKDIKAEDPRCSPLSAFNGRTLKEWLPAAHVHIKHESSVSLAVVQGDL